MARVYSYTGRWIGLADGYADWRLRRGQNPRRLPGYRRAELADYVASAMREADDEMMRHLMANNPLYAAAQ